MVGETRQEAADRFAHGIINGRNHMPHPAARQIMERLRGVTLNVEDADEIIAMVKSRTREAAHPADMAVQHVVQTLTYGLPPGILTDEHVARIVRAATTAGQRPHEFRIPSQSNAERDAGRTPGDIDPERFPTPRRKLEDQSDGLVPGPGGQRIKPYTPPRSENPSYAPPQVFRKLGDNPQA